jgi:hypothetical protein
LVAVHMPRVAARVEIIDHDFDAVRTCVSRGGYGERRRGGRGGKGARRTFGRILLRMDWWRSRRWRDLERRLRGRIIPSRALGRSALRSFGC